MAAARHGAVAAEPAQAVQLPSEHRRRHLLGARHRGEPGMGHAPEPCGIQPEHVVEQPVQPSVGGERQRASHANPSTTCASASSASVHDGPYGSRSDTQRGPYGVDTTVTDASGEGWP